jgi:hypothetical protein
MKLDKIRTITHDKSAKSLRSNQTDTSHQCWARERRKRRFSPTGPRGPVRSKNRNNSRRRGVVWLWDGLAGYPPLLLRPSGSCSLRRGEGAFMEWTRILAYIKGSVDQERLLRNEYVAGDNRIFRAKLNGRLRFSDADRATLGEIGFRLGRRTLSEVATGRPARHDPGMVPVMYARMRAHSIRSPSPPIGKQVLHDRPQKGSNR